VLRVLDLFSGIGGFSLGLERTGGFRTVAFCEIEPYCRAVLRKHWPEVPCFEDVRNLHAGDIGPVDVICGGFPCQDISFAGKGAGLAGDRSGLWWEYHRLIQECAPQWVIAENVSALRSRGLDQVLGSLAALGYDAEWHCIPASAVGAPHRRDRIWIAAHRHTDSDRKPIMPVHAEAFWLQGNVAYADNLGAYGSGPRGAGRNQPSDGGADVADAERERGCGWHAERQDAEDAGQSPGHPRSRTWDVEPAVGRVANGVPSRVDRLRALGNAVVPQIPEIIGRAILAAESQ
jgi:DNA (cytosine-5)-methyltransferase 1